MADDKPEQLTLFMTAPEIKKRLTHSMDQGPNESMDQMWDRKWRQAGGPSGDYFRPGEPTGHAYDEDDKPIGPSLVQSITEHGFHPQRPIDIVHTHDQASLPDAHHRVEVMSRLHPDQFINVQHHTSRFDLSTTGGWVRDYQERHEKRMRDAWPEGMM